MNQSFFTSLSATVSSERILYTPSAFARISLLYLQETGTLQAIKKHVSKRTGLESYLFFTVISGAGSFVYDDTKFLLKTGDCVFIDCRIPYSHSTSDELWSLKWVHFDGEVMRGIYDKYISRGGKVVFRPKKIKRYLVILNQLYRVSNSASYVRDMEINCKLSKLLILLMEDSWNPGNHVFNEKYTQLQKIREYLDRNYMERITLDGLADKFFINKTYLSERFKEQYGVPISTYLISVRITKSKELLRFSDKTMEEIAEQCGIRSAAYFSRLFKRIEGISPNEYRKMWLST